MSSAQLVGETARVCIEGMACTDLSAHGGMVALNLPGEVRPQELDGLTVTVTIASAKDQLAQHGNAVLKYRHETGTCACSGARARVALNVT